jgi:predicted phage-related endonuclease
VEQRSKAWHEARLGKATASRFCDIVATTRSGESASRKNYRAELVIERLTHTPLPSYSNGAMQWGEDFEDVAALAYELKTGHATKKIGFLAKGDVGASPDRLVDPFGLVEIKCPNTATHIETLLAKQAPKKHIPQIQGQLWLSGRKWCDFVSYDPRMPAELQLFIKRVYRDDDYIKWLAEEVIRFLEEVTAEVTKLLQIKEGKGGQKELTAAGINRRSSDKS